MSNMKNAKNAREAGENYSYLADMLDASSTKSPEDIEKYRNYAQPGVRFAALTNSNLDLTEEIINVDPLAKFAIVVNPKAPTSLLDKIAFSSVTSNPILFEMLHKHKKASKEFQVVYALNGSGANKDFYNDPEEQYFFETLFDANSQPLAEVDLESLQALCYLYILGFIEAPSPCVEFWTYFWEEENRIGNFEALIKLYASLPAIPPSLYRSYSAICGFRCTAAMETSDLEVMKSLMWDSLCLDSGSSDGYWQNTYSPRSGVAGNQSASAEILQQMFHEEVLVKTLSGDSHPVFWRLAYNSSTPVGVLAMLTELIDTKVITSEWMQQEILVGHRGDVSLGLMTNPAVEGELREIVENLLFENGLSPGEYEISR